MFNLISENWSMIRDVLAALAPVLAAIGLRRKVLEWLKAFQVRRQSRRKEQAQADYLRSNWYADAYRRLVVNSITGETAFHGYTIQQACARMDQTIPEHLIGWERVRVSRLN